MSLNNFRLTVSVPVFGRPKRTIRSIECIANQNINGWQALIGGDGCPVLQDFILSGYFDDIVQECGKKGNILSIINYDTNKGGYGYSITNANILLARGEYFIFYSNDDMILPNHFKNYLSEIEQTYYDFVYFNTRNDAQGMVREPKLEFGKIGHSELIIKSSFLKQMPKHTNQYGHDWYLIQDMIKNNAKYKKSDNKPTYIVKSVPNLPEFGID